MTDISTRRIIDISMPLENDVLSDPPGYGPNLEKLYNLESLPSHGFTVVCFPVKIRGASAGWTRAVAIL